MAAAMEERSIRIPLQEPAGEFVEVFASELPDEAEDLLFLLREERAPLPIWLQVATEYYRQRRLAQFEAILDVASSTEIEAMYPGPEHKLPKIQILNALAALRVQSGARETDKAKIGALQKDIVKLFERADRMDQMVEATWVTKGVNFLVSHSRLDDASQQFDNALDSSQTNLPAILGKACVHYHQGDFRKALARFSAAITLHPHASNGASVRVGLGICWLKLGNSALAHAAFDRALAIDPTNVDALVAKGVLQQWPVKGEAPEGEKARIEAAMLNITRAYQADTANPTALNHLANHYYWKWSKVDGGTLAATQGSAVLEIEAAAGGSGAGGGVGATLQELMGGKQCQLRLVGAGAGGSAGFTRTVVLVGAAPPSAGAGPGAVMMSEPWAMPSCGGLTAQRRDAKRVIKLANQAKENTKSQRVVAESWYMLGRVAQASGEHDSAFLYFSRALKCWPEFTLASFGVGQACVAVGGEPKEATKHFEKVLRAFPDSVETLCVLASLKTQIAAGSGSGGAAARREALELLTRAVEIRPSDPSIWLDKATLCQSRALVDKNEALEALEAYARAHVLLEARQERVPVELLVNKGVLQMQLEADAAAGGGHSAASVAAELSFMTALELNCGGDRKKAEAQALGGTKECPIEAQNVTICYNLARLHERACSAEKTETAAAIYNGIMDAFEGYHDAYLRLGCIYRDAGNFEKAEQIFTEAAKNALPKSDAAFDAHSLLAKLHMAKPVPKQNLAQKAIECVLKQSKNDPYTKVLYGNMFFDSLDVPDRYEKNMAHSHKYFSDVLQAEPTNIFAANGMGMVLAEKGFLNEAKQVFTHLREASAGLEVPDIWMNLAHVLLAQGRHLEAVSMYENCLTKFAVGVGGSGGKAAHFDNKDRGKLMLYLAHAHYLAAEERRKQDKIDSIEHYTSCILLLRKALRLAPQDLPLRFNLAYTQGQSAVVRLSLLRNGKTNLVRAKDRLEEVQRAVAQVECASSVFRWLEGQSSFENAKAKKAAATCANLEANCSKYITHYETKVKEEAAIMQKKAEDRKRVEEQRMESEAKLKAEQEAMHAKAQEKALKRAQKAQEGAVAMAEAIAPKPKKEKKEKKKAAEESTARAEASGSDDEAAALFGSDDSSEDEAGDASKKTKKRSALDSNSDSSSDSDSDDDDGKAKKKSAAKKAKIFSDSDSSDDDEGKKAAPAPVDKTDLFGSDSDDSDDEAPAPAPAPGPAPTAADGAAVAPPSNKRGRTISDSDDEEESAPAVSSAAPEVKRARTIEDDSEDE